jgi:rhodanese-related sulfurtransferase
MEELVNKSELSLFEFQSKEENLHFEGVWDVDPREVRQKKSQLTLIDVRQPEEYIGELGHIPGSELIVLDTLPEKLHLLDKSNPIVIVCRSGSRSARAAAYLNENGFFHVYNLKGGMILWNDFHFETEA